jgi:hypothetical protein
MPGGARFTTWQVAAAFGFQYPIPGLSVGPAGLQVAFNLFSFKKTDNEKQEEHRYISLGPAAGVSLPALGILKQAPQVWNI